MAMQTLVKTLRRFWQLGSTLTGENLSVLVPGNGSVFVPWNVGKTKSTWNIDLEWGHHWFHGNACPWQFAVPLKGFGCHISCFPSVTRIHHLRQRFCPSWRVVPLNVRVSGRNVPSPCDGRRFSSWCLTVWKKATAVTHVFDSCTTNQQI